MVNLGYYGYAYKNDMISEPEAADWFRKAADGGYAAAMYWLAKCHEDGRGVTKSMLKAAEWYGRGAVAGHVSCMIAIGKILYYGEHLDKDVEEAKKWFRKAIAAGDNSWGEAKECLARAERGERSLRAPSNGW